MSMFVSTKGGSAPQVDEFDLLEQGACREVIQKHAIQPAKQAWQECYVSSEGKKVFMLHDERTGKVLFTAKRVKDDFYISQYEDFPITFKGPEKKAAAPKQQLDNSGVDIETNKQRKRYCAVLKLNKSKRGHTLYSCSCELCDDFLHKFNCGTLASDELRQILAIVSHRNQTIDQTDISARCLDVQVPALLNQSDRVVWCPRTTSSGVHTNMTQENLRLRRMSTQEWEQEQQKEIEAIDQQEEEEEESKDSDDDERQTYGNRTSHFNKSRLRRSLSSAFTKSEKGDRFFFGTKLPEWNDDIGSLVLKFRNGRVRMASSKNFILADKSDSSRAIFQLGKFDEGRFNLDFRHPVSPLQAFGIALSAYGFTLKEA